MVHRRLVSTFGPVEEPEAVAVGQQRQPVEMRVRRSLLACLVGREELQPGHFQVLRCRPQVAVAVVVDLLLS